MKVFFKWRYQLGGIFAAGLISILLFTSSGCFSGVDNFRPIESHYVYLEPNYNKISLNGTSDTIHFALPEDFYNTIESFNLFEKNDTTYCTFFNKFSRSILIFNLETKSLAGRVLLEDTILGDKRNNVSIYCFNFDSILISTSEKIYLMDTNSIALHVLPLKTKKGGDIDLNEAIKVQAILENTRPPVFRNDSLWVAARPTYFRERSLYLQKRFHLLYSFDFSDRRSILLYNYPAFYQENYLGSNFLWYSYCISRNNEFVFSFSGDPNIYVTNLKDTSVSYFGKSSHQTTDLIPFSEVPNTKNDEFKKYMTNQRYGAIFYDSYHGRYLRFSSAGLSESEYAKEIRVWKQYVTIFDEQFRIIGESELPSDINPSKLIVTKNGDIYARTNFKDENAFHFVRLEYK